jgi:pheromone shutdown-related protein TraB
MSETIKRVTLRDREVILVGTAHISHESVNEVTETIKAEKPDHVCVEIDAGRYKSMTETNQWERLDIVKVLKTGQGFLLLANLVLASFQRRMGSAMGNAPGEEMKAAVVTAQELGIPFHFCDREVATTFKRAWAKSSFWNKSKLLASLASSAFSNEKLSEEEIESLKNKSAIDDMMGELADYLPQVKEVLIDERDRFLAAKIYESGVGKSVAVIGAGHMGGVEAWLNKLSADEASSDTEEINSVPKGSPVGKIIGWAIPAAIVALMVVGFFVSGKELTLSKFLGWILLNGTLSAVGSIICLAHPLTILVSFISAPFATLNPFVSVGLFAALTEAAVRKPRVQDFEGLSTDATSVRGFWKNRVTRILLIFFLSSLGGMIGNIISIPYLSTLLLK